MQNQNVSVFQTCWMDQHLRKMSLDGKTTNGRIICFGQKKKGNRQRLKSQDKKYDWVDILVAGKNDQCLK